MAYVSSYSLATSGSVAQASWPEAWDTAASWKGYLQGFPGLLAVRISARTLDEGDVRVRLVTVWEHREQLEEWAACPYAATKLLAGLDTPAYDVIEEAFEDLS
jgi:heme-degrading monooxygenase HmoA